MIARQARQLFLFASLTWTLPAAASDRPPAQWSASCQFGEHTLRLQFTSATGDAFEDDMHLRVSIDESSERWPLPPGLYLETSTVIDIDNNCRGLIGTPLGRHFLVLAKRDARPGSNHLIALLVDANGRALGESVDLGELKFDELVLRRAGSDRIEIRVIRDYLADATCDCRAAQIEDWLQVWADHGQLKQAWRDAGCADPGRNASSPDEG